MKALVVILRGLPAGALGPYGNRFVETPTLNALAARGVVYDWHFSARPGRGPSMWDSGRYEFPPEGDGPLAEPRPSLGEALDDAGVSRHRANDGEGEALAEARGLLDDLAGEEKWLVWVELSALLPPWRIGEEVLEAYFAPPAADEEDDEDEEEDEGLAEEYLDEEEAIEPLFAPEPGPIDATDDAHYRRVQTTFAAAVTQLDLMLDDLLSAAGDDVLVVVTSDGGQALGEHGVVGPVRPWLHEEVVHVPLILAGPGCPPGRRVEALTASVDLAPTLAAHFGVALPEAQGHDIRPASLGEAGPRRDYVCAGHVVAGAAEWALRTAGWALRVPSGDDPPRLYVKPDDRCEVNDVAQHHPDLAEALRRTLLAFVEATRAPGPLAAPPLQTGAAADDLSAATP